MTSDLRIVVTGLAATYPLGGVFWDYAQYLLGLHRLGHDVLYLEDTGQWCYDVENETFVEDGAKNARLLADRLGALEPALAARWSFRDGGGETYGRPRREVAEFCRTADLFIHISASCWMREEYFSAGRVVFIDSDPMYTQASVPGYLAGSADAAARQRVETLRRHDAFFTFAENIGAPGCRVPRDLFDWKPTRQPVVLDCFAGSIVPVAERRPVATTVASWQTREGGPVVDGVAYGGKGMEFERFLTLPGLSPVPLELALSGAAPRERLRGHGWKVHDGHDLSADPWSYRDYLARSLAEWSVAKNAYVASRSGWFSCRSACYLALAVPVVVQDTGFGRAIPTGEGVLAFSTVEEAAEALEEVAAHPGRHAEAARAIAEEFFASDKVLGRLVEEAMSSSTREPAVPAHEGASQCATPASGSR